MQDTEIQALARLGLFLDAIRKDAPSVFHRRVILLGESLTADLIMFSKAHDTITPEQRHRWAQNLYGELFCMRHQQPDQHHDDAPF